MKRIFPRPWLAGLLCTLALPAWAAFTDNGDGTITDTTTGLVWDKCSHGQTWDNTTPPGTCTGTASIHAWAAALAQAAVANTASHRNFTDWRLPNRTELDSLVKIDAFNPAIDFTVFPATPGGEYWTSTTQWQSPANAWFVDFTNGGVTFPGDKAVAYKVRLVRSGQWSAAFDAPDASAPVLSAPGVTGTAATTTTLQATSDEAATGYWIAVPQGSAAPTAAQVKAGVSYGAVTLAAAGNGPMTAAVPASFSVTGLIPGTAYTLYLVAEDGDTNLSTPPVSVNATTAAPLVNGTCGSAHGVAVLAAPTGNLCSAGTAGSVTGTAPAFTWNCTGTSSTMACSAPRQYSVTPAAGAGGSLSPASAQVVNYNATTSFTVTPNAGNVIGAVTGCGGVLAGSTYTTGAVAADCTVSASFSAAPPTTYPINISIGIGGSVVCGPNPVPHGTNATCTATPNTGYGFIGWGGHCSGTSNPCILTNVTAARVVSAQFAPQSAQAIPTLSEWAMLLLSGLMGLVTVRVLRRR